METTTTRPPASLRGSTGVFNRMRGAIINGEYHFNERLPSERHLAEHFSAARGTIRAALTQLEQANLVRCEFGSGAFVTYNNLLDQESIAEKTSPLDMVETRLAIEPHIVKLVVTNASHRDLAKLNEALEHVVASKNDPVAFSSADEAFHMMLAHCSQNPLLIWMYQRFNDVRAHSQWSERKTDLLSVEKIIKYNLQHSELMRLITRRDIEGAAQLRIAQLNEIKKDLLGSE